MTELVPYDESRRKTMVDLIAAFFADYFFITEHEKVEVDQQRLFWAEEGLQEFLDNKEAKVFFIEEDGLEAGVLVLRTHGGSVVWIEDLYVKEEMRRRGIATRAIELAEKYAAEVMNAPAISMDVSPRNENAMKLYHSLGYDIISEITLRKSISEEKRNEPVEFFGYKFFK